MGDAQRGRMQRCARESNSLRIGAAGKQIAALHRARFAVPWIDQQRMSEGGEVHADLVRPTGQRTTRAEGHGAESLQRSEVGARAPRSCVPGVRYAHGSASRLDEREIAAQRRREVAAYQREVCLLRPARFESDVQRAVRDTGQTEQDDSAGIPVEPVHDEGPGREDTHLRG